MPDTQTDAVRWANMRLKKVVHGLVFSRRSSRSVRSRRIVSESPSCDGSSLTRAKSALFAHSSTDATCSEEVSISATYRMSEGPTASEETLTARELSWIRELRDALDGSELERCTNVMMVQLALVGKGRASKGVDRLRKMEGWRAKYSLSEISFEEGFRDFNRTCQPDGAGCLCYFGRTKAGMTGFCAKYSTMSYPQSERDWAHAYRAIIGVFDAMCSSLRDVRAGACFIPETSGISFAKLSVATELRYAGLYFSGYPIKVSQIVVLDPTSWVRIAIRGICAALPSKYGGRFCTSRLRDGTFYSTYVAADLPTLPQFMGGGGPADGDTLVSSSLAAWERLLARRARWEAELVRQYGQGFSSL